MKNVTTVVAKDKALMCIVDNMNVSLSWHLCSVLGDIKYICSNFTLEMNFIF